MAIPSQPTGIILSAREFAHRVLYRLPYYEAPARLTDEVCKWIGDLDEELLKRGIDVTSLPSP